jgi:hypothetical protein
MANTPELTPFDELMQQAQVANGAGYYASANNFYNQAFDLVGDPAIADPLDTVRAARGAYETSFRLGVGASDLEEWRSETAVALDSALRAIDPHGIEGILLSPTDLPKEAHPTLRELIQTNTVLGKVTMRQAISRERGSLLGRRSVGAGAEATILNHLREAGQLLPVVEGDGPIDQYRINWEFPAATAERLYGSRRAAAKIAAQALRHARLSESPQLPTSAGLPEEARAAAASRARKRALTAAGALVLPRADVLSLAAKAL